MAYIVLTSKGEEIDRRELEGPLTVGRAPDCELSVRDILLSRRHCRIEPSGRGWIITDLQSKNGTWLDGQPVGRRGLQTGDVIRIGKTAVRFMAGEMPARLNSNEKTGRVRPADPFDTMGGTIAAFEFKNEGGGPDIADPAPVPVGRRGRKFPSPRPVPPEPAGYVEDDIYSMLTEIASSSWDSIYANASRPIRPQARVMLATTPQGSTPVPKAESATATVGEVKAIRRRMASPANPMVAAQNVYQQPAPPTGERSRSGRALPPLELQANARRVPRRTLPLVLPEEPHTLWKRIVDRLWRLRMRLNGNTRLSGDAPRSGVRGC